MGREEQDIEVATLGHPDAGRTTLAAAILKVQSKKKKAAAQDYSDLAKQREGSSATSNAWRILPPWWCSSASATRTTWMKW